MPPTPLIKLAIHILSICPNSASCERLFSTFGLVLTKLRTRLSNQKLVDIAECKMHIRDEHLQAETKAKIRARLFGVNPQASAGAGSGDTGVTPSVVPATTAESDAGPDPRVSDPTPDPSLPSLMQSLSDRLINLIDEDQDIGEPAMRTDSSEDDDEAPKQTISNLFDFSKRDWVSNAQRSAMKSLEDEIRFYDLVDLDAAGEADLDYDLDDSIESIFTN